MNFILILIGCLIPLCRARRENEVQALSTIKLMKKNFFNGGSRLQNHRPTDSTYFYPKPSGLRLVNNGLKRFKPARVKPFRTYGPPAESSRPQITSNKPNHQNQPLKFEDPKKLPEIFNHQPVHSLPLSHAIANQNDVPFKHNANYLPPQNQQLPGYFASNQFSRSHLNNQNQVYNVENSVISDAAQFLTQNSHAIAQLYETPQQNSQQQHQNDLFEPVNDLKTLTNVPEFNNRPSNLIFKQNVEEFPGSLVLNKQDMEFNRNTQNHGNFLASQDLSSFTAQTALHQPLSFDNLVQNHRFKPYGVSDAGIFSNQTFSVPTLTSLTASSFGTHEKPIFTPSYGQSGVVSSTNLLTVPPTSFRTSFPAAGSSDSTPGIFNNKPFNFLNTPKFTFPSVSPSIPTNFHFPINQVPIFPLATRPTEPIYGFPTTPVVKPVKPTYLYLLNSAK